MWLGVSSGLKSLYFLTYNIHLILRSYFMSLASVSHLFPLSALVKMKGNILGDRWNSPVYVFLLFFFCKLSFSIPLWVSHLAFFQGHFWIWISSFQVLVELLQESARALWVLSGTSVQTPISTVLTGPLTHGAPRKDARRVPRGAITQHLNGTSEHHSIIAEAEMFCLLLHYSGFLTARSNTHHGLVCWWLLR